MKKYYPTYHNGCNPIHCVNNWCYVRSIIRARLKGVDIPPILIDGGIGNGNMLNGTHRSAANDIMVMLCYDEKYLIDVVTLSDIDITDDLKDAIDNNDYERIDELLDRND